MHVSSTSGQAAYHLDAYKYLLIVLHCSAFESKETVYKGKIDVTAFVQEPGFQPYLGPHVAHGGTTLDAKQG